MDETTKIDYLQRYCSQIMKEAKWQVAQTKERRERLVSHAASTIHEQLDRYYTGLIDGCLLLLEAIKDMHEIGYIKKLD